MQTTLTVRLSVKEAKDLQAICKLSGNTRSEVVRDIIRRAEFEWAWKKGMTIAVKKKTTEDTEAEREAAFQVLGKRFPR